MFAIKPPWGSQQEVERRNRIRLSVAAFAYEVMDAPIMPDYEYDELARSIRPSVATGHNVLDVFFRFTFSPDTGMWVHHHPELDKLARLYERHYARH